MNESRIVFSGKVLVVDDDFAVRIIACETLEQAGFEVKAVENGLEALSLFTSFNPDIILLDLLMPGMDGFQTCTEIRSLPGGNEVPILILTGLDDLESITSAFELGANDFEAKPIQWLVLPYRIQNLIQASTAKLERNQAITALQEREQRLDFLLTNSPAVIYTCKCSGDFGATFVSKNVCKILGYNENDFLSDSGFWANHIHPDDAERVFSALTALTTDGSHSTEYRFRHKDGTYRWMRDESLMLYNAECQPTEVIGFYLDINTRKLAEERLLVSELKYHSLFESMTDGFASVDIGGRIVEFNKAFSKIIGYVSEEIRDLTYETITPEEWHAFEKNIIETQVMVRGYSDLYEKEYRCKDGSILPIELRTYLSRDHNAIPTGMWAIIRDVSERKRSESEKLALKQLLHQAQKLESLGVLAGGIAHDFNNILAIIMGYCSLGQMKPEMAAGFMPEIEKASERAATLCRQMLAYAGKTQIIKCSINLEEVLDDTLGILKSTLPKNVAIKHTIEGGIPKILAEDKQIKQIIMDLLINAAEAIGEEQGEILVAMTKTEFIQGHKEMDHLGKTIVPGVYLCLEVTDNGCGMDDETKRRIFDPFFSTKFAGRGLAMSAVLGFVASYEGALQLTSQVGHGTTVKIYLPSPPGCSGAETAKMTDSAPWQGTGLILLVDDEPQIIEVSRAMLEKIGFSVIEATNGIEALEQYRKRSAEIRIVVTDIGMPQMGGYELVHELKKLDPKLPIIVSSGFGDTAVTSRISPGDIAGLISKPYKFDQLRDVLMNVVEGATESIRDVK